MSKILSFYRNIIVKNANAFFNTECVVLGFAFYIVFCIIGVCYFTISPIINPIAILLFTFVSIATILSSIINTIFVIKWVNKNNIEFLHRAYNESKSFFVIFSFWFLIVMFVVNIVLSIANIADKFSEFVNSYGK